MPHVRTPVLLVPATMADIDRLSPRLIAGIEHGFADRDAGVGMLRDVMAQFATISRPARWGSFWSVDTAGERMVGLSGFKAPPANGAVEIGYLTFPRYEGHGYATRTIAALVAHAWREVALVVAHTLPLPNASNAVLARHGFSHVGEVLDPEDGLVWRWEKSRRA
ncbi:GNAT family N-acetyltransferase [Sphingomonas sp. RT2P30]|uniref:GNAT family N-acetyltransferase n=1 Tax=Parasphingomonas halimpatiens TaxID=3096162 RepID=UPI002FCAE87E